MRAVTRSSRARAAVEPLPKRADGRVPAEAEGLLRGGLPALVEGPRGRAAAFGAAARRGQPGLGGRSGFVKTQLLQHGVEFFRRDAAADFDRQVFEPMQQLEVPLRRLRLGALE